MLTTAKPRKLVFSTAKRDAPRTLARAERDDLTINSAIALREMDWLFLASPKAAPSPGLAEVPEFASFQPNALFQDSGTNFED